MPRTMIRQDRKSNVLELVCLAMCAAGMLGVMGCTHEHIRELYPDHRSDCASLPQRATENAEYKESPGFLVAGAGGIESRHDLASSSWHIVDVLMSSGQNPKLDPLVGGDLVGSFRSQVQSSASIELRGVPPFCGWRVVPVSQSNVRTLEDVDYPDGAAAVRLYREESGIVAELYLRDGTLGAVGTLDDIGLPHGQWSWPGYGGYLCHYEHGNIVGPCIETENGGVCHRVFQVLHGKAHGVDCWFERGVIVARIHWFMGELSGWTTTFDPLGRPERSSFYAKNVLIEEIVFD